MIVGGATVRADDPLLTSRGRRPREPLRVVLSRELDLPRTARLWDQAVARTLVAHGPQAPQEARGRLDRLGVERLELSRCEPLPLLEALAGRGCNQVLWECGPELAAAALRQSCVQRLAAVIAPKLLGGRAAATPLGSLDLTDLSAGTGLPAGHDAEAGAGPAPGGDARSGLQHLSGAARSGPPQRPASARRSSRSWRPGAQDDVGGDHSLIQAIAALCSRTEEDEPIDIVYRQGHMAADSQESLRGTESVMVQSIILDPAWIPACHASPVRWSPPSLPQEWGEPACCRRLPTMSRLH